MQAIKKYKDHFGVYIDGELLAVCLYKKGAIAIKDLLDGLDVIALPRYGEKEANSNK